MRGFFIGIDFSFMFAHIVIMTENKLTRLLLDWFRVHGRDMPWRYRGGAHPEPYHVLISEFMLQQTTVQTVYSYFDRFIARFPDIKTLAQASEEDVYGMWQGLGYYTRARSLHRAAQQIHQFYNDQIPPDHTLLLQLPGIGPYTAASILSLGFNIPQTVIDGNVKRVVTRMFGMDQPIDTISAEIQEHAKALTSHVHPADYASAIMDLGATVCTPKNPCCDKCPWVEYCIAHQTGTQDLIPQIKKLDKKLRHENVYLITNTMGEVFIRKRPGRGLLAGLYEFPWDEKPTAEYVDTDITVTHTFTHFKLVLNLCVIQTNQMDIDGQFIAINDLEKYPMSTLMKKVIQTAIKNDLIK